jgi:hypothetical protein
MHEAQEGFSTPMSGTSMPEAVEPDEPDDQRAYFRWAFKGTAFPCRMGKKKFEIRLRDLSRSGASGLVDEPFAVGDFFFIELADHRVVEAEVCWVRRVMIGVRFGNPLTARFVTRLHELAAEAAARRQRDALLAQYANKR